MTMTVYMQPMEGLVARGRRTDGPSRLVPVDGLWECRCRVGVVKPHASADRTADTTRGDTVPWESCKPYTPYAEKSMKLMPF